jgi:elongation factor Ts
VVGEGIEKKSGDFAAEVAAQVSKAKKDESSQPEKTT